MLTEVRTSTQQPQQPSQQSSHSNPGSPTSSVCPSKPPSNADTNEICLYFIRRHCGFKGNDHDDGSCLSYLQYSNISTRIGLCPYVYRLINECLVCLFHRQVCACPLASALQMAGFRHWWCNLEGLAHYGGNWKGILWPSKRDELHGTTFVQLRAFQISVSSKVHEETEHRDVQCTQFVVHLQ